MELDISIVEFDSWDGSSEGAKAIARLGRFSAKRLPLPKFFNLPLKGYDWSSHTISPRMRTDANRESSSSGDPKW